MRILAWLARIVLKLLYRVRVEGLAHLDAAGERVLLVANHTSFLDAMLLTLFLPGRISFAIHSSYAAKWWLQPVKSLVRLFAIDHSDPMAMKGLIRHLQDGHRVVIFPEGRITPTGALMKIYPGPGMVAEKADATLLPVRIDGAQYTRFSRLRGRVRIRWFPAIRLTILPPRKLDLPAEMNARERRHEAGRQLADIMAEMMFATTPQRQLLWETLLDAGGIHGSDFEVLEDIRRQPLSYRGLTTRALLLGDLLRDCGGQGSVVGVLLPNSTSTLTTFFALQSRGMVPAMLNYTMGSRGAIEALETAEIRTVITSRKFEEMAGLEELIAALAGHARVIYLEDLAPCAGIGRRLRAALQARRARGLLHRRLKGVSPDDAAVVLFTSGSEGLPKGVVLSHANILANVAQIRSHVDLTPNDLSLNALPLFHSFGLTSGALLPMLSGIRVFLYPSPLHYRVIPEVAYELNATLLFGTNVFLAGYARHAHPYDFYSMRYVVAGAEKLTDETRRIWSEKFGIRIFEGYGATETSPVLAVNTPMHFRAGSVGRLLPGIEAKTVPVPGIGKGGRLLVKGPNVMKGYLRHERPGQLQPPLEGWYDTGDIVEIDHEGYLWIQGRAKRFAKVAGEMVSLAACEELATACWPGEQHAALAVPDPGKGEQIVLLTTQETPVRKALLSCARESGLSEMQVPRMLLQVSAVPLLATGKVHYPAAQALAEKILAGETPV